MRGRKGVGKFGEGMGLACGLLWRLGNSTAFKETLIAIKAINRLRIKSKRIDMTLFPPSYVLSGSCSFQRLLKSQAAVGEKRIFLVGPIWTDTLDRKVMHHNRAPGKCCSLSSECRYLQHLRLLSSEARRHSVLA